MSSTRTLVLGFLLLAATLAGGILFFQSPGPEPAPGAGAVEPEREAPPPHRGGTLPPRLQGAPATAGEESASAAGAPLPTESDLAPGDVLVRGRLLTPDGEPPRGGRVELVHGDSVLARRAASVDGTFAIMVRAADVPASADTGLRATDTAGHEAALQVQFGRMARRGGPAQEPGRVVDVGVVRLLPLHALEIQVRFPSGATPPALVQAGATGMLPTGIGPFLPLASTHRTDAEGRLRLDLPEGTARIIAVAEGSGRQVAWVTMPREESGPLVIELPPERLVTVEVVDGASGAPVPDAEVTASEMVQAPGASYVTSAAWWPPLDPSHTDAKGRLVMRGIGTDQRVWVVANAEGYPIAAGIPPRFQTVRIEPGATSVRIEMAPPRTVRWPIEKGHVPAPGEGTAIVIRPAPGTYLADVQIPTQGCIESGDLVVSGWPPGYLHGLAVAPDGSMARLGAKEGEDVGYPITFFPSRRIEVLVRYPDGEPAQGWFVNLRNQGNNPLAPPAPTGTDGRAVIEGLYGGPHGLVQVHVSDRNEAWSGTPVGTVDLAKGDGNLEATVERTREAVLRFTLGGAPHLPPDPRISLGTTYAASPERDEEAGEVHFSWRPQPGRAEAPLHVEADGFLPIARQVDVPDPGTPLVLEIALEAAGAFVLRVTLPKDNQVRVAVQQWKTETSTWESLWLPMTRMGGYAQPDANGIIRFTPLAAGRYRALETLAGVASPTVEVEPGASPQEVALDLGRAGYAKGRVVVPEGHEPGGVTVHLEGVEDFASGPGSPERGVTTRTQKDGTFMVRVPGDREVVLRPAAPTLRPHSTEGTARVSLPRDEIVLRLVLDSTAFISFDQPLAADGLYVRSPGQGPTRNVCLYAGKAEGEPLLRTTARLEGEAHELVFGGFDPGTYTVWIDAAPFAPVVLPGRVLGAGATDLGEVSVQEGARIAVEVLIPEGQAAPRAWIGARREAQPSYSRRTNFQGTSAVLSGLGPGRWEVTVGTHMGGNLYHKQTVDLQEGEEKRITVDAR